VGRGKDQSEARVGYDRVCAVRSIAMMGKLMSSPRATCSILGWDPRQTSTSSSVGELNANCEARVMDDDGVYEVRRGQRGELWVRAPNIMKGY
jgi:acyl-CoA synthetase (AMP-forming)/AMP-acid ligase II